MNEEIFVSRVEQLGGFEGKAGAMRAIRATIVALGERLQDDERSALSRALPPGFRMLLERAAYAGDFDRDGLFARVARHGGLDRGHAVECAQMVCRALAASLPMEPLTRLTKELGPSIASLFVEPEPVPTLPRVRETAGSTLASGRPGSRHPLSEARADRSQGDSRGPSPGPRTK